MHEEMFIPGQTPVRYAGRVYGEKEIEYLTDAVNEFWLTYGKWSRRFESEFAEKMGVKFSLLVNSGSSANLLAFSVLTSPLLGSRQFRREDEMITVAAGFPTTIAPCIQYGGVPVFVDVELNTANIDTTKLELALSEKTKAVMVAHTLGNPFNIKAVKEFCEKHGLWLIEDNCDALGSEYDGKYTGTWGDIGTSSFYPAHHITTGEGGMVYTDNPLLRKIALSIRDWGRDCWCDSGRDNTCRCRYTKQFGKLPVGYDHKYVYSHFGYNLKATDLQAAIGCAQLERLTEFTTARRDHFIYMKNGISDLPELKVISSYDKSVPSWFGFPVRVESERFTRNDITKYLEDHKIQTRNIFAGNILKHPCFDTLVEGKDYRIAGDLPNTDRIMNDFFWLGVYPGMTEEKMDYMVKTIHDFIATV